MFFDIAKWKADVDLDLDGRHACRSVVSVSVPDTQENYPGVIITEDDGDPATGDVLEAGLFVKRLGNIEGIEGCKRWLRFSDRTKVRIAVPGQTPGMPAESEIEIPGDIHQDYELEIVQNGTWSAGDSVSVELFIKDPKGFELGYRDRVRFVEPDIRIKYPSGDPALSATDWSNPNSVAANYRNEVTYQMDDVPVLKIMCEAEPTVNPEGLRWAIAPIGEITARWSPHVAGNEQIGLGPIAMAEFYGLPSRHDSFGLKTIVLTMEGISDRDIQCVEVFFPKNSNYPDEESGIPNWFFYWNQIPGIGDSDAVYRSDMLSARGKVPALKQWSPAMTFGKEEIWIGPAAGVDSYSIVHDSWTFGIDAFANVIRHENGHVQQIKLADDTLGSYSGQSGTIWEKGWSWLYVGPDWREYNHFVPGQDGKPGLPNVNDDDDWLTDELSDNGEFSVTEDANNSDIDDVWLDRNHDDIPDIYENVSPAWLEEFCENLETVENGDLSQYDWGAPGKQHKHLNQYDD